MAVLVAVIFCVVGKLSLGSGSPPLKDVTFEVPKIRRVIDALKTSIAEEDAQLPNPLRVTHHPWTAMPGADDKDRQIFYKEGEYWNNLPQREQEHAHSELKDIIEELLPMYQKAPYYGLQKRDAKTVYFYTFSMNIAFLLTGAPLSVLLLSGLAFLPTPTGQADSNALTNGVVFGLGIIGLACMAIAAQNLFRLVA